jgi:hypothetical protein
LVSTLKAGSYSVIAMAAPSTAHTAYNIHGCVTCDQPTKPAAASAEPALMTLRPWPRSMAEPTAKVVAPHTPRPSVSAPIIVALSQCRSRCIGSTKDENA